MSGKGFPDYFFIVYYRDMPNILIILPLVSAIVTGGIAIFYFFLFSRKRDFSIFSKFAIAAIFVMVYDIASIFFYASN